MTVTVTREYTAAHGTVAFTTITAAFRRCFAFRFLLAAPWVPVSSQLRSRLMCGARVE